MLGNFRRWNRAIVCIANGDVVAANEGMQIALRSQTPLPIPLLTMAACAAISPIFSLRC